MSMVGNLRKVARLARRGRRVDLSNPARSPLGSTVVNCVVYRDGLRQKAAPTVEESVARVRERGHGFVWLGLHEPTLFNAPPSQPCTPSRAQELPAPSEARPAPAARHHQGPCAGSRLWVAASIRSGGAGCPG